MRSHHHHTHQGLGLPCWCTVYYIGWSGENDERGHVEAMQAKAKQSSIQRHPPQL